MDTYRSILSYDYGEQVALRFMEWSRLPVEDEPRFLEAHKHRQRGEELPFVYIGDQLYWTGQLSLREIVEELEKRGLTRA